MRPFRVLVTGGRNYGNRPAVFAKLDALAKEHSVLFVIEGGATGADRFARDWRQSRLHPGKSFKISQAAWDAHGKAAGPMQNRKMLVDGQPGPRGGLSRRHRHRRHGGAGHGLWVPGG